MKPIPVRAGESSEVEALLKTAIELEKAIEEHGNNDVHFEDVSGTNVRAQHYGTNQQTLPEPETVAKKVIQDNSPPGLGSLSGNTHQTESTLGMHVTDGGGDRPAALKKSQLLGAWKEDDPYSVNALVGKVEELARRL
jgi:hypothetical protein